MQRKNCSRPPSGNDSTIFSFFFPFFFFLFANINFRHDSVPRVVCESLLFVLCHNVE